MSGDRCKFVPRGFTLIELLVVIAIISLLVAILTPTLSLARQIAYKARCMVHLGQLSNACANYAASNDRFLPGPEGIVEYFGLPNNPYGIAACRPIETGLLAKDGFVTDPKIWLCPAVTTKSPGIHYNWSDQQIEDYPYTYHYTWNRRTMLNPACDRGGYPPSGESSKAGYWKAGVWHITWQRQIDSFRDPSRAILLAEENTGMIEWDGVPLSPGSQVINDPFFTYPDVSEPRHLDMSMAGYLDGHAGEIPPYVDLLRDTEYWPDTPK